MLSRRDLTGGLAQERFPGEFRWVWSCALRRTPSTEGDSETVRIGFCGFRSSDLRRDAAPEGSLKNGWQPSFAGFGLVPSAGRRPRRAAQERFVARRGRCPRSPKGTVSEEPEGDGVRGARELPCVAF